MNIRYAHSKYPLKPLNDVIEYIQYGISELATSEPIGVPMLRMNNLQEDGWDLSDLKYIELDQEKLAKYRIQKGDILFNRTNSKELVGKCEVFKEDGDWVFASYLIRVRLNKQQALPDFVTAFLNTNAGRLQIDRVSRQIIGMSNVNAEELKELVIPLPDLTIQRALVKELEVARVAQKANFKKAESLLKGVEESVLDKLGLLVDTENRIKTFATTSGSVKSRFDVDYHNPRFRKLRERIAETRHQLFTIEKILLKPPTTGFAAGRSDQTDDAKLGVPHIRPFNITPAGEFSLESIKYVPTKNLQERDLLQKGEVLFNNTNSTEWVGKSAVFDSEQKCACSNHITRLSINPEIASPYFVALLFNAFRSVGLFGLLSTNFNNQAGINNETLLTLQIPMPELKVQEKIVAETQRRRTESRRLIAEASQTWETAKTKFEKTLLEEGD